MLEGGCACGAVRYALSAPPLIVHACHCRDCQRLTGSAFVLNLWIERRCVELRAGAPKSFALSAGSGQDHQVFRCEGCGSALWSRYQAPPGDTLFVRAGTLDHPGAVAPDVHIFTRSKLPWIALPAGVPAFESMYRDFASVWSRESLARFRRNIAESAERCAASLARPDGPA
jgi:hypothetical protein